MINFEYYNPTRVIYGKGTQKELGKHLRPLAKKATDLATGEEYPLGGVKKLYWQDVLNIYNMAN